MLSRVLPAGATETKFEGTLTERFEKLFIDVLKVRLVEDARGLVVVIDALDELAPVEDKNALLRLLKEWRGGLRRPG